MDKYGNFSCRIGVQTFGTDAEAPNSPLAPSVGNGLSAVTTVTKNVFDFDPTNASNGDTSNGKMGVRIGVLYKATSAAVARGEVLLEVMAVIS